LIVFASTARAQFSIYGTVAATDYGYAFNSGGLTYNGDYLGLGGGLTYIFPRDRRLTLGIDLRDYVTPAARGGNTGVVSFRIGVVPHKVPLRPYFQIGPGYVSAKVPAVVGPQTVDIAAVSIGGGLDIRVARHIDLRVIEIESTAGVSATQSAGTASFGTGVVYHLQAARPTNP
jgi:hypothetical protein